MAESCVCYSFGASSFLPLAFAGIALGRLSSPPSWLGIAMLGLGALAAILDWTVYIDPCFFEVNRFALSAYTRPSLIFLAVAVMILVLRTNAPANPMVSFMARHSLGVYCLHPFFIPVRYKLVEKLHLTGAAEVLIPPGSRAGTVLSGIDCAGPVSSR